MFIYLFVCFYHIKYFILISKNNTHFDNTSCYMNSKMISLTGIKANVESFAASKIELFLFFNNEMFSPAESNIS